MKLPLSWLKDYVDIDLPVTDLAERMTLAGLEVETIEYVGLPGAELEWDRERIVVGQIREHLRSMLLDQPQRLASVGGVGHLELSPNEVEHIAAKASSPKPGNGLVTSGASASGVTSRGVIPVPP